MTNLGYKNYFVQGGDIGAGVSSWLARLYPESVLGMHLNFIPASYQPFVGEGTPPLSAEEQGWLRTRQSWLEEEGAYSHLQGTRPQTLAYAVTDSPVGLAAWIFEKYRAWSDCDGDVLSKFSMDELLTTASIYWLSGNVAATLRIYKENRESTLRLEREERIRPPLAYASFPKEICPPLQAWIARGYTVSRWSEMPSGGHFAAMEEPHLLAQDIRASFEAFS
jgi:pimeloyl-ACP methyl ester carboxylesterase